MRRIIAVLAVSVCSLAAGCGGDSPSEKTPQIDVTPTPTSADGLSQPLDRYLVDPNAADVLAKARGILIRDCMESYGFQNYDGNAVGTALSNLNTAPLSEKRWFFVSPADAKTYGFHDPVQVRRARTAEPERPATTDPRRRQAENLVLNGWASSPGSAKESGGKPVPERGCVGVADDRISEGAELSEEIGTTLLDVDNFVNRLISDSAGRMTADERYIDVTRRWSSCMKDSGFSYDAPIDAYLDPKWSQTELPTNSEIAVATAYASCAEKTNWLGVASALMKGYQNQAIEENSQALKSVLDYRRARVANATRIIAAG